MKRIIGLVLALALIVLAIPLAASAAPGVLDRVVITPATANITTDGAQQFTAVGQDSENVTIADLSFTWTVVNGGGNITAAGLFTAGNETGTFTNTVNVTAFQSGSNATVSAVATVIVNAPEPEPVLGRVMISPVTANITVNSTRQFTAVAQDTDNVTIEDAEFIWAVVNGGGNITAGGLFTAGNVTGTFTNTVKVRTTVDNVSMSAFATVTVNAAEVEQVLGRIIVSPVTANVTKGGAQQFTAVAQDTDNVTIEDVEFTWAVVNGGGNITANGLFTAGNTTGTFTDTVKVAATVDNVTKSAFATVIVTAPAVKPPVRLPPGFSQGEKKGWNGGDVPPGWDNGNKTGWGGAEVPPGFSKGEKNGWGHEVAPDDGDAPANANQGKGRTANKGRGNGKP